MSDQLSPVQAALDQVNGDHRGLDELFARAMSRMEEIARRMLKSFERVAVLEQTGDLVPEVSVRLPADLRDVFDLLGYDGLTRDEAAELRKTSVPTVERRWRDAKLAMNEFLGDRLPGELS